MHATGDTRRSRLRRESGASTVEYAILVAGTGVALIAGVVVLTESARALFQATAAGINASESDPSAPGQPAPPAPTPPTPTDLPTWAADPTPTATPAESPSEQSPSATPKPTPTSASPTPTRPEDAIEVRRGEDADKQDVGANKGSRDLTATVDPESAGTVEWDSYDLVLIVSKSAPTGSVITVRWSYTQGNKTFSGTLTYWVVR